MIQSKTQRLGMGIFIQFVLSKVWVLSPIGLEERRKINIGETV